MSCLLRVLHVDFLAHGKFNESGLARDNCQEMLDIWSPPLRAFVGFRAGEITPPAGCILCIGVLKTDTPEVQK